MAATEQNFSVRRGDDSPTVAFALTAADGSPAPAPLSWAWKYAAAPGGPVIVTKTGTNLVSVILNGVTFLAVPVSLAASETGAMTGGQNYFHELEVTTAAGKLDTPTTGRIFVTAGMR